MAQSGSPGSTLMRADHADQPGHVHRADRPLGRHAHHAWTPNYQMNTFIYRPNRDRECRSRIFAEDVVPAAPGARQRDNLAICQFRSHPVIVLNPGGARASPPLCAGSSLRPSVCELAQIRSL